MVTCHSHRSHGSHSHGSHGNCGKADAATFGPPYAATFVPYPYVKCPCDLYLICSVFLNFRKLLISLSPALEDLREEHRMAMVAAADTYTETIKKERYERELTATKKDDGEMEKEVAATSAIAELRGMVDGLEGQLAQKANEITEALEQQLQQAKRFEEDTVALFDDNKRYQKQIEDVKVQLLA